MQFEIIMRAAIDGINTVINLAAPLAEGNPIPDSSEYQSWIDNFPRIDSLTDEAYELAMQNESIREQAKTIIEASDRINAVFTMFCDLLPARDVREYDFSSVAMILPYLTFTLNALSDIVDDLNSGLAMDSKQETEFVPISKDNPIYTCILAFVVESLADCAKQSETVRKYRVFLLRQLEYFRHGDDAEEFEFSFHGPETMITCALRNRELSLSCMSYSMENKNLDWQAAISQEGTVSGVVETDTLNDLEDRFLIIELPERFHWNEMEDDG